MILLLLAMILIGCQSTKQLQEVRQAAATQAIAKAATHLPKTPDYCRKEMPEVIPAENEKWRWVQKRWLIVREAVNKQIKWCAEDRDRIADYAANGEGGK